MGKYQIIHEDDKHFKIHNPKDGTHFVVAKKGLSAEFIQKAQKLCGGGYVKMSEGGEVNAPSADLPVQDGLDLSVPTSVTPTAPTQAPSPDDLVNKFESDQVARETNQNPSMVDPNYQGGGGSEMPIDTSPAPSSAQPQGTLDQRSDSLDAIAKNEKGALYGMAKAKQTEGNAIAKIADDQAAQAKAAFDQQQQAHADVEKENAPLREGILNQKIDPNRLWNNASTGQKISASIGLILGGIGAGLTKGPNSALEVMQKSIDRDVQSQRDELGKKQTLYSMNMDRYKNADAAYSATMLNLATVAKTQIEAAAARSGSQQAMSQAQLAGAQIDERIAPLKQQLAIQKMSMQNADPVGRQVRILVPEKEQPAVYSELEKSQNAVKIKDSLMREFQKADSENTVMGRAMHFGFSPQSIANMKAMVVPLLKDEAGRVTEPELERVDGFLPTPGDSRAKIDEKRKGLMEFITAKEATPRASSYGIKPAGGGRFDDQGKSRFTEGKPKL